MDDSLVIAEINDLQKKIDGASLPEGLREKAVGMIKRLKFIVHGGSFALEYENAARYIEWITAIPWSKPSKDILDLNHAKESLNKTHYGLTDVKEKILEYLSVLIMKDLRHASVVKLGHAPILCLVGLVGTGKTTISYSIADALGRKHVRIPFGGMGGAALLRGQSRVFPDAEPGLIIKALRRASTDNPVILLDEIDRIAQDSLSDIMGVLVELLDPEQNANFTDHFIDYPFDLSNVLFIATANNTGHISNAVLDRLEVLQMPSYTDKEKVVIGKQYMLPKALVDAGLTAQDIVVDDDVWELIVRPLGYDPGIRTLQRTIQGLTRRIDLYMLEGKIKQNEPFRITAGNVKEYLPQW